MLMSRTHIFSINGNNHQQNFERFHGFKNFWVLAKREKKFAKF